MTLGTSVVGLAIVWVLQIYVLILIARIVVDYVFLFARDWRPSGVALVLVEAIYTVTDPPIKLLCRILPPLRVGMFDLRITVAFLILFLGIQLLIPLAARI